MNIFIVGGGDIVFGNSSKEINQTKHYYWLRKYKYNIIGVLEPNNDRAEFIRERVGVPVINDLQELESEKLSYDTVLIASPDTTHLDYLRYFASKTNVENIVCEKPLIGSTGSIKNELCQYLKNKNIYLNLSRRFSQDHAPLINIKNFRSDKPFTIQVNYSKGILHNGIHAIDLLIPVIDQEFNVLKTSQLVDYEMRDPTVSAVLWNSDFRICLNGFNDNKFSIFEIDIIGKNDRVRFIRSGLEMESFQVRPDNVYEGYRELFRVERKCTDLSSSMAKLYQDLQSGSYEYILDKLDIDRIDRSNRLIDLLINSQIGKVYNVSW